MEETCISNTFELRNKTSSLHVKFKLVFSDHFKD